MSTEQPYFFQRSWSLNWVMTLFSTWVRPYCTCMLVVGEKEAASDSVSVRLRHGGDAGTMSLVEFVGAAREMTLASLSSFMRASSDFRAPSGLAQLTAPTLVMRGQREAKVIKRSVPEVAALVPGARTAMAPGLSHPWPLMDVELFVRACKSWFLGGEVATGLVPVS